MSDITKSVTEADVVALYISGKNYYEIALEVYGFDSEDALKKVRELLEKAEEDGKFITEDKKAK
jgi:hypothetical protein